MIAGEAIGENDLFLVCRPCKQSRRRHRQGAVPFRRTRQTQAQVFLDLEAIDDGIDVVLLAEVERGRLIELIDFAVDSRANKALCLQVSHELHVLALAVCNDRREQHQPGAFRQCEHLVDHLAYRLSLERAVRDPDTSACRRARNRRRR